MKAYFTQKILILAFAFSALTSATTAQAAYTDYETVTIIGNFTVAPASTQSVQLNGVHRVRNIVVQAEGVGSDSTVEVMVNGQVKGTI